MKKIGAFAGKFLPPHIGHISQIKQSAKQVDELRVVLAENPEKVKKLCQSEGLPYINKDIRLAWLKESFKDESNIKFYYMDETGLESFPEDMEKWAEKFKKIVGNDVNVKFADETYRELNEKYFAECEFASFDRTIIDISATKIRQNPKKFFDYISLPAQEYFNKIIKEKEAKK